MFAHICVRTCARVCTPLSLPLFSFLLASFSSSPPLSFLCVHEEPKRACLWGLFCAAKWVDKHQQMSPWQFVCCRHQNIPVSRSAGAPKRREVQRNRREEKNESTYPIHRFTSKRAHNRCKALHKQQHAWHGTRTLWVAANKCGTDGFEQPLRLLLRCALQQHNTVCALLAALVQAHIDFHARFATPVHATSSAVHVIKAQVPGCHHASDMSK